MSPSLNHRPTATTGRTLVAAAACALALSSTGVASAFAVDKSPQPAAAAAATATASARQTGSGTDFWLAQYKNYYDAVDSPGRSVAKLQIGSSVNTSGTVEIPGIAFSANFTVSAGGFTVVDLPPEAIMLAGETVADLGIHVTSVKPVVVYPINEKLTTSDTYLGLPTADLGTSYVAVSYPTNTGGSNDKAGGSLVAVVATVDATDVTFTPPPGAGGGGGPQRTEFTRTLNKGQSYLAEMDFVGQDFTGWSITATNPVAVFSGNQCTNVPTSVTTCNHLIEQLPPTSDLGTSFVAVAPATRADAVYRVVASNDATTVNHPGGPTVLGQGEFVEFAAPGAVEITSDKPVLVAQYAKGQASDGNGNADPGMALIAPVDKLMGDYLVTTPAAGFADNWLSIVAKTADLASVAVDGTAVDPATFTPVSTSEWSAGTVQIAVGAHRVSGASDMAVTVYGWQAEGSYMNPGGMAEAPVPTTLVLTPETDEALVGESRCVTAAVSDQWGDPMDSVDVAFAVTGANPSTATVATTAGAAELCWAGANPGLDDIVATAGAATDTATKSWTAPTTTTTIAETTTTTVAETTTTEAPTSTSTTVAETTTTEAPTSTTSTTLPSAAGGGGGQPLPRTGSNTGPLGALGAALLAAGSGVLALRRRLHTA